ncbi:MAG TPA: hypothetical protein VGI33_12670 [Paenibacillus sp.]
MQRTTRTTSNQPNRSTPIPANRMVSGQTRAANTQANRTTVSQSGGTANPKNPSGNGNTVVCRKCKSGQLVANKRGYSFAKMFKTLGIMVLLPIIIVLIMFVGFMYMARSTNEGLLAFIGIICWISVSLSLPVSILVGFIGRSEIVNGCMNCGFKWTPAKRK